MRRRTACFSIVDASSSKTRVEVAAGLAGLHHRHEQGVEDLGMLGARGRERRAALDLHPHFTEHPAKLLVLDLARQDPERPDNRKARVDHGGELTGGDRDLVELDAVGEARDRDLPVHVHARFGRDRQTGDTPSRVACRPPAPGCRPRAGPRRGCRCGPGPCSRMSLPCRTPTRSGGCGGLPRSGTGRTRPLR